MRCDLKKIIIVILSIIFFGIFVFFLFKESATNVDKASTIKKNKESDSLVIPPSADSVFQEVKELFEQLYPDDFVTDDQSYVWWISSDGYNIINLKEFGIKARFDCKNQTYGRFHNDNVTKILAPEFPSFMQKRGFIENELNTSKSITEFMNSHSYDYHQAYEKGNIKCILRVDPSCGDESWNGNFRQDLSFTCTSNYEKNYFEQMPILKDLGIKVGDGFLTFGKKHGDFAFFNIHDGVSGYTILAINENGKWKKITQGQDPAIKCSLVDQYHIPKEIYNKCY